MSALKGLLIAMGTVVLAPGIAAAQRKPGSVCGLHARRISALGRGGKKNDIKLQ
jgi:hypothetical protein